jgi:hypothetical protein
MIIGGSAGGTQGMLTSLSNNKKLRPDRKSLFMRRPKFSGLRDDYRNLSQTILSGKKATPEELKLIREKVLQQRKRDAIRQISIWIVVSCCVLTGIGMWYNSFQQKSEEKATSILAKESADALSGYEANMLEGLKKVEEKKFFYAVGHFENALDYIPHDELAEYQLAKTFCMMCYHQNHACKTAKSIVDSLSQAVKNPSDYQFLREKYLNQSKPNN